MTGVDLIKAVRKISPYVQVIMMTGMPAIETASESLRAGAFDYLYKPIRKDAILKAVRNALKIKMLEDQNLNSRTTEPGGMDLLVAVGMRVASHPPHRSQRAELPHWAPTLGSDVHAQVRIWMANAGSWEPAVNESIHSFPVYTMALAATKQRFIPKATHMEVK